MVTIFTSYMNTYTAHTSFPDVLELPTSDLALCKNLLFILQRSHLSYYPAYV